MAENEENRERLSAALAALPPHGVARALWRGWATYQIERAVKDGRSDWRAIVRDAPPEAAATRREEPR
jgi:hypothetical protein